MVRTIGSRGWPRPTRATGWALAFIGGYVVLADLVMELGPAGLLPGGHSSAALASGLAVLAAGAAVLESTEA